MPRIISKVLRKSAKQSFVLWQKIASDNRGRPSYNDPVEAKCRWEDGDVETIDIGGRTVLASGYIMTIQPLAEGDLVMQGLITDWKVLPTYPQLPTFQQGGREVVRVKKTPDLKAVENLFEAWLGKR